MADTRLSNLNPAVWSALRSARDWANWVKAHTPRSVGEMSTYLIGGGGGGWLAWIGAVGASFPPHKLHYWAVSSQLATAAIGLGLITRWLGSKDDPRIELLQNQVDTQGTSITNLHKHIDAQNAQIAFLMRPTGAITESVGPSYASASVGANGPMVPGEPSSSGPQGPIGPTGAVRSIVSPLGPQGPTWRTPPHAQTGGGNTDDGRES